MFLTNGTLTIKKPGEILDHGILVPDYENMVETVLGRFSIQPARSRGAGPSTEDQNRAIAADTSLVAYGDLNTSITHHDEIRAKFDNGMTLDNLQVNGTPDFWVAPAALGLSHVCIELKYREEQAQ